MWAHDYPFKKLKPLMMKLKPHQKVNKLPGSGFVTNKVNLATSNSPFIPKAFRIPNDTEKLKQYAAENPNTMFVQKNSLVVIVILKEILKFCDYSKEVFGFQRFSKGHI